MNENTTHTNLLMRYLDKELNPTEQQTVEDMMAGNADLQQELDQLAMTRDSIRIIGLKEQLTKVRKEMKEAPVASTAPKGKIRTLLFARLSVAASILIILGLAVFYEYNSISSGSLYSSNYREYTLLQSRGEANGSAMEDAFKNNRYQQVISLFNKASAHTAEDYFLAGNANLAQNNAGEAVKNFTDLQQENKTEQTHYFEDDVEYYLAMSYLKNDQPSLALPLFKKINEYKAHPYHDKVSKWFLWKLELFSRK